MRTPSVCAEKRCLCLGEVFPAHLKTPLIRWLGPGARYRRPGRHLRDDARAATVLLPSRIANWARSPGSAKRRSVSRHRLATIELLVKPGSNGFSLMQAVSLRGKILYWGETKATGRPLARLLEPGGFLEKGYNKLTTQSANARCGKRRETAARPVSRAARFRSF